MTEDHLGSPRIITDGTGTVVSRHDYLAFGDEVTETVGNVGGRTSAQGYGETDEIRKQYTGYERDKESGLDFAQARYYNSNHGRFTSVDPLTASASIRNPQTFNRYSYVLNSPYKFTDPLGLLAETTGACGSRCANGGAVGGGFVGLYSDAGSVGQTINVGERLIGSRDISFLLNGGTTPAAPSNNSTPSQQQSQPYNLDYSWSTNVNGANTTPVSEIVDGLLDKAVSSMTSNIVEAMGAFHFLEKFSGKQVAIGLSGQRGVVQIVVASTDQILRELGAANDAIQARLVVELKEEISPIAGQNDPIKLGEAPSVAPFDHMAANFADLVRRKANEAARAIYNETFPKRKTDAYGVTWDYAYPTAFHYQDH